MKNGLRPNVLLIMADQLAAPALAAYGNAVVRTPNIDRLAREGAVFENAYCNYPQCAPSRASMLTGRLCSRIGVYDNAAELRASTPTLMHYLRTLGYRTVLSGKMHFVGPDQLHGFEERLTTDIYPADFTWCPDWEAEQLDYPWAHRIEVIESSGLCARSLQIDYDEETAFKAEQAIYDLARQRDGKPFFLTVSFTHPHNPYVTTPEYWGRYDCDEIDVPQVPPIPFERCDPHSQRLHEQIGLNRHRPSAEAIRNARHAYYAMISYVDDQVGRLLAALEAASLAEDTVVIFTSDHGEMLGERGLFYKMNFFEWSARIPLIVRVPGRPPAMRHRGAVSLVDLMPTILDLAGLPEDGLVDELDGTSLLPLLDGDVASRGADHAYGEYLAEGTLAPCLMIRRGRFKFIYSDADPIQLYDLEADPLELENLGGNDEHRETVSGFIEELRGIWHPEKLRTQIVESQRARLTIQKARSAGHPPPWDYQSFTNDREKYVRSGGAVADVEPRMRLAVRAGRD